MDFATAQERKRPVVVTETIVLDQQWAEKAAEARNEVQRLENRVATLRRFADAAVAPEQIDAYTSQADDVEVELEAAKEKVAEFRAQQAEYVIQFKFRSMSPREYDGLVKRHRPTAEQRQEAKRNNEQAPGWNIDTFPPALVAACLLEPAWTADEIELLYDPGSAWNPAELFALFQAAQRSVNAKPVIDLGEG